MATKMRWADMTDDDDDTQLPEPVTVSKHGVKVKTKTKPPYVPPHLRDKSKNPPINKDLE